MADIENGALVSLAARLSALETAWDIVPDLPAARADDGITIPTAAPLRAVYVRFFALLLQVAPAATIDATVEDTEGDVSATVAGTTVEGFLQVQIDLVKWCSPSTPSPFRWYGASTPFANGGTFELDTGFPLTFTLRRSCTCVVPVHLHCWARQPMRQL